MATYTKYKDSVPRVWGRFWDADDGEPVDPSPLTFTVEAPGEDPETVTYPHASIVKVEEGVFYARVPLTTTGMYLCKWLAGDADDATAVIVKINSVTRGSL